MSKTAARYAALLVTVLAATGIAPRARDDAGQAPAASTAAAGYDVVVMKDVPVLVRRGFTLRADVYLPAKDGKVIAGRFGTLLQRSWRSPDRSR